MFLVMGITGRVGGAAAADLLAKGKQVRALVRDPQKATAWKDKGVELVQGDWNDAAAITKALEGVEGAYIMMPPVMAPSPDFGEAKAVASAYREALHKAPPPKLVALSSIGSEKHEKLGLITGTHLMEKGLWNNTFPTAFIRAGSFMENFLYGLESGKGGTFPVMYTPTGRDVPMIATRDIGALVAELLTTDWKGRRIIELGTPTTPDAYAKQLGEVLGREVRAEAVPRSAWPATLEHMGIPKGSTWGYEEMLDSFNSGWIAFGVPGTEPRKGTATPKDVLTSLVK